MLIGIETRLLNRHGSEMEMEMLWITRKDCRKWKRNWKCNGKIKTRWNMNKKWKNSSKRSKWKNRKIMVMEQRDEMEILQARLGLLSKSLYGSGCRKLCKG